MHDEHQLFTPHYKILLTYTPLFIVTIFFFLFFYLVFHIF